MMNSPKTSPSTPSYMRKDGFLVQLRSNYELAFAYHLDLAGVPWEYETKTFPYEGADGKIHHYYPDFYLPEQDLIIEVSSAWTNRDEKDRKIRALKMLGQRVIEVKQSYLQRLPLFEGRRWKVSFGEADPGPINHVQKLRELIFSA